MVAVAAVIACLGPRAEARERPGSRIITALDDGRFLLARSTDEGVILRFCGNRGNSDDPIILLRDYSYVQAVQWLEEKRTVVVAAGQEESAPDLFGFSPEGSRLWQQDCGEALWEARFLPLPGDSALGFVPAYGTRGTPRPLSVPGAIDTAPQSYDGSSRWNVVGEGTRVVEWRSDGDALKVTCRDILLPEPVWSTTLPDSQAECRCRESGGVVGARTAWLAWQCDFEPFPVSAVELESGREVARRTFGGYAARLFAEPGGRRLLMWLQDYDHRGRMLLLDGLTLATLDTLVVPDGWYPRNFNGGGNSRSADRLTLANVRDCGLPKGTRDADVKLEPLALVVNWGEPVSIRLLPVAACLDARGEVKVWYEWFSDGSWRHIDVETWKPPLNPQDEQRWYERWSRIRR